MKITTVKREGTDVVADKVIVDEASIELGDYRMGQTSLGEQLSGQIITIAQLRGICPIDQLANRYDEPEIFPFQVAKAPERYVHLRGDKALSLILEELLTTIPDETEVRFD